MSTCTIVTPQNLSSAPFPVRPTGFQIAASRLLARAFGHGWACSPLGPTDAEMVNLGFEAAGALWERRAETSHGSGAAEDLGLMPRFDEHKQIVHTTGSGTVSWLVEPCGAVQIVVRGTTSYNHGCGRQEGPVIYRALAAPHNRLSPGALVGGMVAPGVGWPPDGYAKDCAKAALTALGFNTTSLEPWVAPLPRPALSAGPVRKL